MNSILIIVEHLFGLNLTTTEKQLGPLGGATSASGAGHYPAVLTF